LPDSAYLFDSSVWVALTFTVHPGHSAASEAFAKATEARPATFCRSTEQSVLRLITTPAIMRQYGAPAMSNAQALTALHSFQSPATVRYREEPAGLVPLWHSLADRLTASPKVWMDAYLAAFAVAGQLTMVTFDKDFKSYVTNGLTLQLLAAD